MGKKSVTCTTVKHVKHTEVNPDHWVLGFVTGCLETVPGASYRVLDEDGKLYLIETTGHGVVAGSELSKVIRRRAEMHGADWVKDNTQNLKMWEVIPHRPKVRYRDLTVLMLCRNSRGFFFYHPPQKETEMKDNTPTNPVNEELQARAAVLEEDMKGILQQVVGRVISNALRTGRFPTNNEIQMLEVGFNNMVSTMLATSNHPIYGQIPPTIFNPSFGNYTELKR